MTKVKAQCFGFLCNLICLFTNDISDIRSGKLNQLMSKIKLKLDQMLPLNFNKTIKFTQKEGFGFFFHKRLSNFLTDRLPDQITNILYTFLK